MMMTSYFSCIAFLLSDESDRRSPGARGPAQLRVGEDERELADAVGGERARIEVLDDKDAVAHVEPLRHLERPCRVLGRHGAVAPGVAAGERDAPRREPLRD